MICIFLVGLKAMCQLQQVKGGPAYGHAPVEGWEVLAEGQQGSSLQRLSRTLAS